MAMEKIRNAVRKNWFSYLLLTALLVFIFNRDAKAWLLRQVLRTGFFDAKIEKQDTRLVNTTDTADFSLTDPGGNKVDIATFRGKVVLLNFWASWCPPCRAEFPSLEAFYRKMKSDPGLVILSINEDDDAAMGREFILSKGYTIPVYTRAGNLPADVFSGSLPTTVVLDKRGVVRMKEEGMANYNNSKFQDQLRLMINE